MSLTQLRTKPHLSMSPEPICQDRGQEREEGGFWPESGKMLLAPPPRLPEKLYWDGFLPRPLAHELLCGGDVNLMAIAFHHLVKKKKKKKSLNLAGVLNGRVGVPCLG